jgi:hypothetical protein
MAPGACAERASTCAWRSRTSVIRICTVPAGFKKAFGSTEPSSRLHDAHRITASRQTREFAFVENRRDFLDSIQGNVMKEISSQPAQRFDLEAVESLVFRRNVRRSSV